LIECRRKSINIRKTRKGKGKGKEARRNEEKRGNWLGIRQANKMLKPKDLRYKGKKLELRPEAAKRDRTKEKNE
jgi:hypothetical protein